MGNPAVSESVQDKKHRISFHSRILDGMPKEMRLPEEIGKQSLTDYAEQLAEDYIKSNNLKGRKSKGQFFTPKEIGLFMANMFDIDKPCFNILDPGAGLGILSAAFCERILRSDKTVSLSIDAYETDSNLIPYLEKVLKKCKLTLEREGHAVSYRIIEKDFILDNPNYLNSIWKSQLKPIRIFLRLTCLLPWHTLNGEVVVCII